MKQLLLLLGIFIILSSRAGEPTITQEQSMFITVNINSNTYEIMIDPERPYTVWISETEYYESNDLNEVIEYLYNLK